MPGRVYVHQMKDPRLAEAYCDRMYDAQRRVAKTGSAAAGARRGGGGSLAGGLGAQPSYDMYLALIQVEPCPACAGKSRCSPSCHVDAVHACWVFWGHAVLPRRPAQQPRCGTSTSRLHAAMQPVLIFLAQPLVRL